MGELTHIMWASHLLCGRVCCGRICLWANSPVTHLIIRPFSPESTVKTSVFPSTDKHKELHVKIVTKERRKVICRPNLLRINKALVSFWPLLYLDKDQDFQRPLFPSPPSNADQKRESQIQCFYRVTFCGSPCKI